MTTNLLALLLAVNAAIAFVFCWGMWQRAGGVSLSWPPTFLRAVAAWVGGKGIWLGAVAYLWARDRVGYTAAATAFDHWLYPATLAVFTFWHAYAVFCWITGRAIIAEIAPPAVERDDVTGIIFERRQGWGRRHGDRRP